MKSPLAPRNSAEVAAVVRESLASRRALEPTGGGTHVHIGSAPTQELTEISLTALGGIVDYVPEDLVVVAEAGMTVSSLQSILRANGQQLPLEVSMPDRQTLGGIVACRAQSLTRAAYGSVRDWLIGCRVIGGEGQEIVAGGKVVKNVAGYDLPKLYCGSWGTLGILTVTAVKVAPLPERRTVLLATLSAEHNAEAALDALSHGARPTFTFLLNSDAAHAVLGENAPDAQFLVLGFDGRADESGALAARAESALKKHAFQIMELPTDVGERLRTLLRDLPLAPSPLTVRCSILPSQVGAFARMLEWTSRRAGFAATVLADSSAGTVWAHIRPRDGESQDSDMADTGRWARLYTDLRDKMDRVGGASVIERMPQPWRDAGHSVWSPEPAAAAWMSGIKQALDPHKIFRPGRFLAGL